MDQPHNHDNHLPKKDFTSYRKAAAYLLKRLRSHYGGLVESDKVRDEQHHHDADESITTPTLGIICGSGLSTLSHALTGNILTVQYSEIPGFPSSCSVPGHEGEIVFGFLGKQNGTNIHTKEQQQNEDNVLFTAVFRGRFHGYEGFDMDTVVLPTRVMRCPGVKLQLVPNAAGGLHPNYQVGDIVCIMDHISIPLLAGSKNPLIGPNDDELGPRFPPTSNAYDPILQQVVVQASKNCGLQDVLHTEGTYCFVSGPNYESKKECQFLRMIGGDAVGMSTGTFIQFFF